MTKLSETQVAALNFCVLTTLGGDTHGDPPSEASLKSVRTMLRWAAQGKLVLTMAPTPGVCRSLVIYTDLPTS